MKPQTRSDDADAFIPDPSNGAGEPIPDDLAEYLGEGFVQSVTTGDDADENMRDEITPDEVGGPFVETRDRDEFADIAKKKGPRGDQGEVEAFPTAVALPPDDTDSDEEDDDELDDEEFDDEKEI